MKSELTVMLLLLLRLWTAEGRAVLGRRSVAWDRCQELSQNVTALAWGILPKMGNLELPREEITGEAVDDVPHIQCGDGCDHQSLTVNSQLCLQQIHRGLIFYGHLLNSDIFTGEPSLLHDGPVGQLHSSLLGLSQLLQPKDQAWKKQQVPRPKEPWQRLLLRPKILQRLRAFAAIAARVFTHGAATLSP
ncbi:interleukin-23 subunit alpha [Trichosurus vulpecula]|uniref:interleukin-23 subunit alpha n=1 Tax=Trichosurus vulpecula TaxID=9337 RepID=UPI00186B345F|nr:interleukin-23 subunit alpha [Trichosurus vulpecula]